MTETTHVNGPWSRETPAEIVPAGTPPDSGLSVEFTGKRGALFWLALKTGFFTILTLGFYRFWMKTRLRRWYWSAMRPGGHPLEYVGDPWEKLLGFFIAVVILTFYIGIVNLLLMFVSFSVFNSSVIGYALSFAGVIPVWFYARYRARRYVLGRTRWRGVRFGLEPGAWGYAWRALVHWLLTIVTLGVLWPRMTFWLEKYKTDRTFFGSARLVQNGRWQMLIPATWPFVLSLLALGTVLFSVFYWEPIFPEGTFDEAFFKEGLEEIMQGRRQIVKIEHAGRLLLVPVCMLGLLFGAIYYRWTSKRIMANQKSANGIEFASSLSGARVTLIYVFGNFIAYLTLVLFLIFAGMVIGILLQGGTAQIPGAEFVSSLPQWFTVSVLAVLYLSFFLLWGVLYNTFVTFPLMRHMALTTSLPLAVGLPLISQRERDEFAEAEGFAEALDLGAAI